ncbi:MAG: hypothetical protein OEV49_12600 [candidate division Zixibacteria bacterium]|nr:hypothetical protein [candidate division Zixibacteria bacterium]MDH3936975.1 hypothetical protein [candidate division Zixibacteria bacterium]MDH4032796.1 hypothetical protein [candidate division Zixibacteria bacterium]
MRVASVIVFGLASILVMMFTLVPNANSGADAGSCADCHDSMLSERTNHFIDTEDDCMFCHETDIGGGDNHVITYTEKDICLACHVEQDRTAATDVHGNLNCIECHDPHGSNHNYSLSTEGISLCSETCHTSDQLGNSHIVGEGALHTKTGEVMTCFSDCHSIHKPQQDAMLLQMAEQDRLCGQCHDDKI